MRTRLRVSRFMIAAEHQRRGHGARALARLIEEIRAGGTRRLRIMHGPVNRVAAKLYERAGFRRIGVLEDGDMEREPELVPSPRR